jgi:hypothetical protein
LRLAYLDKGAPLTLPLVTNLTRERTARELDGRGPAACMMETLEELRETNPEVLDMASKCAASFGARSESVLLEFVIFYRLLRSEYKAMDSRLRLLTPFPRVTAGTRNRLVELIDDEGLEAFTLRAIEELELHNPELLQMAHASASRAGDYLPLMQGFALIYKALSEQAATDTGPATLH